MGFLSSSINQLIVNKFLDHFAENLFQIRTIKNANDFQKKKIFQLHYQTIKVDLPEL